MQFPGESAGLFDLASFKNGISAERLKALIARGNLPSANGYVGQTPLSAQQRNEILNNRALDAVRNNSNVRFGFCVQRSDLRSVPFAQRVTSKPNDRFGDTLQESVVLQNEPLAVLHESADGKFLFVAAYFYVGWINSDSVALCSSFKQWQALLAPENDFLVVTGSSFRLCRDPYEPLVSELELTMGMRLSLAEKPGTVKSVRGRMSYDNYIVNVPSRAADGSLKFIEALVPISRDVHIGYMPFTYSNVIRLADKTRGEIYGWGGMLDARDCSALVMEIYRCFGIMLPRNTSDLAKLPEKYAADVSSLSAEAKRETILSQPAGVILFFPGHVMIYYGSDGNELLCLSAAGKFTPVQSSATQNVYTVEVCSLDVRLSNGKHGSKPSKDYSNRLRFSRTNYKASCRREIFLSPAACRTKAVNKHLGFKHKPQPASFLYFSHFNPNFVPLRIGVLIGIQIESDNLESVLPIECNCIFIAGLCFQNAHSCAGSFSASEIAFISSVPMPLLRTFPEAAVQAGIDISDFGHSFVPI